jgi:hypothetical protein
MYIYAHLFFVFYHSLNKNFKISSMKFVWVHTSNQSMSSKYLVGGIFENNYEVYFALNFGEISALSFSGTLTWYAMMSRNVIVV